MVVGQDESFDFILRVQEAPGSIRKGERWVQEGSQWEARAGAMLELGGREVGTGWEAFTAPHFPTCPHSPRPPRPGAGASNPHVPTEVPGLNTGASPCPAPSTLPVPPWCHPPVCQGAALPAHLQPIRARLTFLPEIINLDITKGISSSQGHPRAGRGLSLRGPSSAHSLDEWGFRDLAAGSQERREANAAFLAGITAAASSAANRLAGEAGRAASDSESQRAHGAAGMGAAGVGAAQGALARCQGLVSASCSVSTNFSGTPVT